MSQEIEIRLHVPVEALPALRRALLRGAAPKRLQARYYDTDDRRLARAGVGLRLRCEGGQWVQTIKGPTADGMTRAEHNVPLATEPDRPDPALHADHPLGATLQRLLGDAPLRPTFATDIQRRTRTRRLPDGTVVELALDEGALLADGREQAVHEVELELVEGSAAALLALAHALVAQWPLTLDGRSKAERGERLARGEALRPPQRSDARPPAPAGFRGVAPAPGVAALLRAALAPVVGNASQIATGESQPEHLHQLRIAVRRLRAVLALTRGLWPALDALRLGPRLGDWMAELGAVRDRDVQAVLPGLREALVAAGLAPAPDAHDGGRAAQRAVSRTDAQQVLLEVMGAAHALHTLPPPGAGRLRRLLKPRLKAWQRAVLRKAATLEHLDADGRHALRTRAKRLIDAALQLEPVVSPPDWLPALDELQSLLGQWRDAERAAAALPRPVRTPRDAFVNGWLSAQGAALQRQAAAVARRLG